MSYPPDDHFLRALETEIRLEADESATAQIPITPHLCGEGGAVRLGVIATLVDIAGASNLSEFIYPDRMATVSLSLQSRRAARCDQLVARSALLRRGSRQLMVSVEVREGGGQADFEGRPSVAQALLGFSRLQRRADHPDLPPPAQRPSLRRMAHPAARLKQSLLERAGLRVVDAAGGVVEIENHAWVRNSFGTLNGGMVAILVEVAAEQAARAELGSEAVAQDLELHYVGQSGAGPIRSRATRLRADSAQWVARVEVFDAGAGGKLMAVANVHAGLLA